MAEAILHPDPRSFPVGTKVKIKALPATGGAIAGEPSGTLLSEPEVVAAGTLTVTGLTEGVQYVGYANVGGVDRYLLIRVDPVSTGEWTAMESLGAEVAELGGGLQSLRARIETGGRIAFRGGISASAEKTAGQTIFTLPPSLRPPALCEWAVLFDNGGATIMKVAATGVVTFKDAMALGRQLRLDGASFNLT